MKLVPPSPISYSRQSKGQENDAGGLGGYRIALESQAGHGVNFIVAIPSKRKRTQPAREHVHIPKRLLVRQLNERAIA